MAVNRQFLLLLAASLAACAPRLQPASTRPAQFGWTGDANLTLDQIKPVPLLTPPATQPADRPSIDALMLYTQARDAKVRNQPQSAIPLLERAIVLDPYRYDLRYDLGWAYTSAGNADDKAIGSFEKAVLLRPDSLEARAELGRLYLKKKDLPAALMHLRLATQTAAYSSNESKAAAIDFLLGQALKESGYDRAALNKFTQVLTRLQNPNFSLSKGPELASVLARPESLLEQIGELLEKHGNYADALKALKPAADREPDNVELQSRYARDLALNGQRDDALNKAVDLVVRQRASAPSLQVLREVCRALNINDGVVSELRKLSSRRPADRAVLFALADTLVSKNRMTEAWDLLQSAWQKSPSDIAITRRLFMLDKQQDQVEAAAALLIHALSSNPDALHNYVPLWLELLRYGQPNRLRVVSLQLMRVPREDEAARQLWVAVTADDASRYVLQRTSLEAACQYTPPFAPAFRMLLDVVWLRPDLTDAEKIRATDQLAASAKNSGDPALAAELRGRSFSYLKQFAKAADSLAQAKKLGSHSPDLLLATAQAHRDLGQTTQYEQLLWKIISDDPMYADSYEALYACCASPDAASADKAMKVLSAWRTADPQSIGARVLQAQDAAASGRIQDAERIFVSAFADDPDYPKLIADIVQFYRQTGRVDELLPRLEAARTARPRDADLVSRLAVLYSQQNRRAEAVRLLDATRTLFGDDADELYSLVDTYLALDQKQTAEDVLRQVIQLNPTHAGACNGLGFEWADEGKNLSQAEALIRIALAKEPDNVRFLDSLGWVMYKRGNMIEARNCLEQAVAPMSSPNPVVMDHLGDVLYRMSKHDEALSTWEQSLKGLSDDHPDQKKLRLRLMQKIKQAVAKQPVDVAKS